MNALTRTGNSANIDFYGPKAKRTRAYVWAEVLRDVIEKVNGQYRARRVPIYHFTVYRHGSGQVASFLYTPRAKPKDGILPDSTVTRLVRGALSTEKG